MLRGYFNTGEAFVNESVRTVADRFSVLGGAYAAVSAVDIKTRFAAGVALKVACFAAFAVIVSVALHAFCGFIAV